MPFYQVTRTRTDVQAVEADSEQEAISVALDHPMAWSDLDQILEAEEMQ